MLACKIGGNLCQFCRAEIVGSGIDHIAREIDAVGDRTDLLRLDILRHDETRSRGGLPVAGECVGAESPSQSGERCVLEAFAQVIGARRQGRRRLSSDQERDIPPRPKPQKDSCDAAVRIRDKRDLASPRR